MLLIFIAAMVGMAAVAIAVKLVRQAPDNSAYLLRRLNLMEEAPSVIDEAATDVRKEELLSKIPWMHRWLVRIDVSEGLRKILKQADMNWSVAAWLLTSFFGWLGMLCLLYLRFEELTPALVLSLLFLPLPTLYVFRRRRKRFAQIEEQLPDALSLLVSALRVGHSFMTALGFLCRESQEPIRKEFLLCFEEQNFGVDLRTSLVGLVERVPVHDVRIFVAAVLIQKETGGNMAEVLTTLSHTIRERFRLRKQVQVFTAQGRATGWILSLLPVVLGLAMYLVHPEGISLLWKKSIGLKMLYTAGGMNLVGWLIIRKIVSIRV
jgi:tight adherence protein B